MSGQPDPKNEPRVKDPALMRLMHYEGGTCALSSTECEPSLSLHHVYPRSQGGDDVRANLIWLCGSGTTGHHGLVHAKDRKALLALYARLHIGRPDTIEYLISRLGGGIKANEWLQRTYLR